MPRVPLALSASQLKNFRGRLLRWFRARQRDLPWRRTRDPYAIWISEIMLQQTRVVAVVPYYQRFMERYAHVQDLADSPVEDVLGHWAGLGYYSRARNLHRAAQEIVLRHDESFPRDYDAALALPGIGRYTAAAVLSIAYGEPLAVLDGNVARVLARLTLLRKDPRIPAEWQKLSSLAQALLQPRAAGDWNQAMMELGATLCTPKAPRCEECPVAGFCAARRYRATEEIPARRRKRATVRVRLAAAVLLDGRGHTLLVRKAGIHSGLFSNLWQFPALEITSDGATELAAHLRREFGLKGRLSIAPLGVVRHAVTYRDVRIEPHVVHLPKLPRIGTNGNGGGFGTLRIPIHALSRVPVSNATRKIASAVLAHVAES